MERDYLEGIGVDGKTILKLILKNVGRGVMAWFFLAQDRDRWRVLVNAAMNFRVP